MTTTFQPERSLTQQEFAQMATARFGHEVIYWAYECPNCGDIARVRDFPPSKRMLAGIECIGRHVEGRGCKRTAYGMVPGPWAVMLPDGTIADCFALAPAPSQAPQGAAQDSAAPVGHAEPAVASEAAAGPGNGNHTPSDEAPRAECQLFFPESVPSAIPDLPAPIDNPEGWEDSWDRARAAERDDAPLPSEPYLTGDDHAEAEA